jgi:uncharacterized membrane protein YdfJ with MMPL/SSD domain
MRANLEDQSGIQDVLEALDAFRNEQQAANSDLQGSIGSLQDTVSSEKNSIERIEAFTRVNLFVSILTLVFLILHDRKGRTLANIKHVAGLVSERLSLEPEVQKAAIAFCVKHNDLMSFYLTEEGAGQTQSKESPETSSESGKGAGKKG